MASNLRVETAPRRHPGAAERSVPTLGRGPVSRLIFAAFVAFMASLPLEAALMLGGEGRFSIARLAGYGFLGVAILRPGLCFRKPPRALWWFAAYLGLYILRGFYQPWEYQDEIHHSALRLAQFMILFWVGYSLFQQAKVTRWAISAFSGACVAVGSLLALGIGTSEYKNVVGRTTVFGQGPNTIAAIIALGGVALMGMAYGRTEASGKIKAIAWGGFFIIVIAIARTGSRGALIGLGMGLLTLLTSRGSASTRARNAMIAIVALIVCAWITIHSATSSSRWHATLEEGAMSGRQAIYSASWKMIKEKPLAGWGPATNYYELGRRRGLPKRDTHNVFLWLLTEQGILGSAPFLIGLGLCGAAAWRGRRGGQGVLPLALFLTVLAVNQGGTYYVTKWFWLVMAYSLASETYVQRRRVRPTQAAIAMRMAHRPPARATALGTPGALGDWGVS